jgi:hypothetical protein
MTAGGHLIMHPGIRGTRSLVVLASLALASQVLADPNVTVQYNGYVNRSEYVRVETVDRDEFVVLSTFGRLAEHRLPVVSHQEFETFPPIVELVARGGGEKVTVTIRLGRDESEQPRITVKRGDAAERPLVLLPNPEITRKFSGYYNRSSYARVETVNAGMDAVKSSVVLSSFASPVETRCPVTSWKTYRSMPPKHEIVAAHGRSSVVLVVLEGDHPRATIRVDGGPVRPFVLLEE